MDLFQIFRIIVFTLEIIFSKYYSKNWIKIQLQITEMYNFNEKSYSFQFNILRLISLRKLHVQDTNLNSLLKKNNRKGSKFFHYIKHPSFMLLYTNWWLENLISPIRWLWNQIPGCALGKLKITKINRILPLAWFIVWETWNFYFSSTSCNFQILPLKISNNLVLTIYDTRNLKCVKSTVTNLDMTSKPVSLFSSFFILCFCFILNSEFMCIL